LSTIRVTPPEDLDDADADVTPMTATKAAASTSAGTMNLLNSPPPPNLKLDVVAC